MKKHWLRSNVCTEPLISNWYAWSHLLAPTTASANLSKRYLQILQSYIKHPELHLNASKDPKLIGGPYINLPTIEVEKIKALYQSTLVNERQLLELSEAIDRLHAMLENSANGLSLESFYSDVPSQLAGCVELVYDLHNNANIRFIEPLIYQQYYDSNKQSVVLSTINEDMRPFSLSTPYLPSERKISLNIPFSQQSIDMLYQSRREACDLNKLMEILNIVDKQQQQFSTYFTEECPNMHRRYESDGLRVRYFGHACVLMETKNTSILIDPLISYSYNAKPERFSYLDLPNKIDYVLITHNHQDHFDFETLLQIRHQVDQIVIPRNNNGCLADPSLKLILQHIGFGNITQLDELETISFSDGEITGIPFLGEHGDLNIQSKSAYHIKINGRTLLFAVDSNNLDNSLYKKLASHTGPVDTMFIGMECSGAPSSWTYGPLFHKKLNYEFDQSRRLNGSDCDKAWQITEALACKEAYVYAMGQEPWLHHIMGLTYTEDSIQLKEANKFTQRCKQAGLKAGKPYGKSEWHYP